VNAARADSGAFEVQSGLGHGPSVVQTADEVVVVTHCVVEEDLVEDRVAGHFTERSDGHPWLIEPQGEPGNPLVLGNVKIGAGQQHAVVGPHGLAGPHLLAADDPAVTVSAGPRRESGEIGSRAGLAEQLAPGGLTIEDRRDQPIDLP
jgi:hypothetical protein